MDSLWEINFLKWGFVAMSFLGVVIVSLKLAEGLIVLLNRRFKERDEHLLRMIEEARKCPVELPPEPPPLKIRAAKDDGCPQVSQPPLPGITTRRGKSGATPFSRRLSQNASGPATRRGSSSKTSKQG